MGSDLPRRIIPLASLGLCEYCGQLLTLKDIPDDTVNVPWRCPKCKGELSNETFGFEGEGNNARKTKWIGPGGQWTTVKPTKTFFIGNWKIVIQIQQPLLFQ